MQGPHRMMIMPFLRDPSGERFHMKTGRILALGMALGMMAASAPAMAASDAAAGEKMFKKRCKACHTVTENKHKIGPSLFGVVGRKAGSTSFKRYKGLKGADFDWDEASLDKWLKNPKAFVKSMGKRSTSMSFKLKKDGDRANVIEYLKTLK